MRDALKAVHRRVQMMVGRAVIAAIDDGKAMQEVQVELLSDETHDAVEHFQPYGFAAHPKAGAEAISLSVGGLRGHTLLICAADRRYRLKNFAEGEVALHDDQGQIVHLTRDGIVIHGKAITFESEGDIAFSAEGNMIFGCDQFAINSDDVLLGNGASLQAARKTDAVAGSAITGGSSKVKIA